MKMKRSFDNILKHYGHNIFLQRRDDETQKYENKLEKHTVRYDASAALPSTADYVVEGVIRVVDAVYYFRTEAAPKEGDRIYEPDPRYKGKGEQPGKTTFVIDYAAPMRGTDGKIQFYAAGATRESPN